jgi:hypothetical protein
MQSGQVLNCYRAKHQAQGFEKTGITVFMVALSFKWV